MQSSYPTRGVATRQTHRQRSQAPFRRVASRTAPSTEPRSPRGASLRPRRAARCANVVRTQRRAFDWRPPHSKVAARAALPYPRLSRRSRRRARARRDWKRHRSSHGKPNSQRQRRSSRALRGPRIRPWRSPARRANVKRRARYGHSGLYRPSPRARCCAPATSKRSRSHPRARHLRRCGTKRSAIRRPDRSRAPLS